ncbi:hypothetical protein KHQ81_11665 [Mycoplasmatota bacterium]|nr:hypothetical protein KHQ81_11665 [Mycoplasmatota bacterium]
MFNKLIKLNTEPYTKEFIYVIVRDFFQVFLVVVVLFVFTKLSDFNLNILFYPVPFVFILLEILTNRLGIIILIDNLKNKQIKKKLNIKNISLESPFNSRGEVSIVTKLYDKKQNIHRYKIICYDNDNVKYKLKMAMSDSRARALHDLIDYTDKELEIQYLKYSKIIFSIKYDIENNYLNDKEKKRVINLIGKVNRSS